MAPPLTLPQRMSRTAGLFQGLVALPVLIAMGSTLFNELFYYTNYYWTNVYDFIKAAFNCLMAAGILFIIILQRNNTNVSKHTTFIFEAVKSAFATAVWIWLMCDSAWGPERRPSYRPEPVPRGPKIVRSAISVICLLFLFYPTLVLTYLDWKKGEEISDEEQVAGDGAGERTPLLRE